MLSEFFVRFFKYCIASPVICFYAVVAGWKKGELSRYLKALWTGEKFFFVNI